MFILGIFAHSYCLEPEVIILATPQKDRGQSLGTQQVRTQNQALGNEYSPIEVTLKVSGELNLGSKYQGVKPKQTIYRVFPKVYALWFLIAQMIFLSFQI